MDEVTKEHELRARFKLLLAAGDMEAASAAAACLSTPEDQAAAHAEVQAATDAQAMSINSGVF